MTVAELVVKIKANTADFNKNFDKLSKRLAADSKKMREAGKTMTMKVTAPLALMGAAALKAGADFETGMNKVAGLAGLDKTSEMFKKLEGQARELGATTQFSASQAADAMGFLAMAGMEADSIYAAMPHTLNLAAAAQMDLGTSADIVSNVMTGYGLAADDAERATDVLVKAMTSANTDLSQLGEAMKYAGPVASAMGITFEDAAAAIGLMGNAGIQGSMAGTSLRGSLARLANPTAGITDAMTTLGERLGYTSEETEAMMANVGKTGPLENMTGIVQFLEQSGAEAADMLAIFGQRAGPAMAALVSQGSEALEGLKGDLEGAGGTAKRIADIQMEGLKGAMLGLKSAAEAVAISLSSSGLLNWATKLAERVAGLLRWVANLDPKFLKWASVVGIVVAAIGPLLVVLGTLGAAIPAITAGATALGVAFTVATGPIGIITAAIAALVAGSVVLWKNWDKVTAFMQESWLKVKLRILVGVTGILEGIAKVTQFIPGVGKKVEVALEGMRAASTRAAQDVAAFSLSQAEAALAAKREAEALDTQTEAAKDAAESIDTLTGSTEGLTSAQGSLLETTEEVALSSLPHIDRAVATSRAEADSWADVIKKVDAAHVNLKNAIGGTHPTLKTHKDHLGRTVLSATEFGEAHLRGAEAVNTYLASVKDATEDTPKLGLAFNVLKAKLTDKDGLISAFGKDGFSGAVGLAKGALKGFGMDALDIATKAIPGLGPALGIAAGLFKAFGVDVNKVLGNIGNKIKGLGEKILGIFGKSRKAKKKAQTLDQFVSDVAKAGIDLSALDAVSKKAIENIMTPILTSGKASKAELLDALGLEAGALGRTIEDAFGILLQQSVDRGGDAMGAGIFAILNDVGTKLGQEFGLESGAVFEELFAYLGVSMEEAQRLAEEMRARQAGQAGDRDGETSNATGRATQTWAGDAVGQSIASSLTNNNLSNMVGMTPNQQTINVVLDGQTIATSTAPFMAGELEVRGTNF